MLQNDALSIEAFCREERISPATFRYWHKRGFAPRRKAPGSHGWLRISGPELAAWKAKRAEDATAAGKPWLRHPVKALSWLKIATDLEAAQATLAEAADGR